MKATNIGKTIIVWNELSDEKISKLIEALKNIIISYRNFANEQVFSRPIPIALDGNNHHLCIVKKHSEIMLCSTRIKEQDGSHSYNYIAILNADYLYQFLPLLIDPLDEIQNHINILQKFPETKWIELPFSKSFEEYCLTPNINPENFIKKLEQRALSDTYKKFLKDVGISLKESTFSKELQNSIKEANDLFIER